MTDMRDFTPSNDVRAETVFIDSGTGEIKESYTLDDSGGLGEFHRPAEVEEEGTGRSKIIAGVAVALLLGGAGAFAYSMWMPSNNEVVADESLPQPPGPQAAVTPKAPPPPAADTAAGDKMATAPTDTAMNTPARPENAMTAPAAPDVVKPAPRTTQQRVANAPRVTLLPQSSSPASATPPAAPASVAPPTVTPPAAPQNQANAEPVSPVPPASSVAGNPPLNEQSAPVEAQPAAPAAESAPAQAQPSPPAAEPAPAQ